MPKQRHTGHSEKRDVGAIAQAHSLNELKFKSALVKIVLGEFNLKHVETAGAEAHHRVQFYRFYSRNFAGGQLEWSQVSRASTGARPHSARRTDASARRAYPPFTQFTSLQRVNKFSRRFHRMCLRRFTHTRARRFTFAFAGADEDGRAHFRFGPTRRALYSAQVRFVARVIRSPQWRRITTE